MKIFFDNVQFNSSSGPNRFATNLAKTFTQLGHNVVQTPLCDIHLAFIEARAKKQPRSVLIQRLDGIWFKPEDFIVKNERIKSLYQSSDGVVFQSGFDCRMIQHHWGEKANNSRIIHNGFDRIHLSALDHTLESIKTNFHYVFSAAAHWHAQKRLGDVIRIFDKIVEEKSKMNEKCVLLVLGDVPINEMLQYQRSTKNPGSIYFLGEKDISYCLQTFAVSNWFIHPAWLDHCPNVVVQSLTMGTPVICSSSGGTSELLKLDCSDPSLFGIIIEDSPYSYELMNYDDPPPLNLDNFDVELVNKRAIDWRRPFSRVANEYLSFATTLLEGNAT